MPAKSTVLCNRSSIIQRIGPKKGLIPYLPETVLLYLQDNVRMVVSDIGATIFYLVTA